LGKLQKYAVKYKELGDSRSSLRKSWIQLMWAVDATNLDSLRERVSDSMAILVEILQVKKMWLIYYSWFFIVVSSMIS
jgi:hypothetical protein